MNGVEDSRAPKTRSTSRDMAQIAVFAALIAALGLPGAITVGFSGVPITVQTLGVILAPAVLGARKGTAAVAVFIALTIIGLLTARIVPKYPLVPALLINAVGGVAVIYLFGTLGLLLRTDLGVLAAIQANGVFLPGDLLKVVVATIVAKGVHRAYPGLIRG